MKVISIHSHKGGAGKTTVALFLAKALAQKGQKVCVIDLDFVGSGIELALDVDKEKKKTLNDYLVDKKFKNTEIDKLLSVYQDNEVQDNFYIILNKSPQEKKSSKREDVIDYLRYEISTRWIQSRLKILFEELKNKNFHYCILDCHPGIFELSRLIIENDISHILYFITINDRVHSYGLLNEIAALKNKIKNKETFFIVNKRIIDEIKYDSFDNFINNLKTAQFEDVREGINAIMRTNSVSIKKENYFLLETDEKYSSYVIIANTGKLSPVTEVFKNMANKI